MKNSTKVLLVCFALLCGFYKTYASKTILGASVFNPTDVTSVIQNAFNSTVDTVIIQNVGQPWVVQPLFIRRDNLTVIFEPGVIIQAKSGAFATSSLCLLSVGNGHPIIVKNVNLIGYGATFKMLKPEYTFGEQRHCLKLSRVQNVNVFGLTLNDSGGDGILVNRDFYGAPCVNVHIKDCVADNNRRQGISVISAQNLLIENCEFKNTYGTAPMAGIDIEPDGLDPLTTQQVLKNIVVKNCRFTNNGTNLYSASGIEVALHQPAAIVGPISITFENCYVTGLRGISVIAHKDVTGVVNFNQCLVENISEVGLDLHNSAYAGTNLPIGSNPNFAFVRFKQCVFKNLANDYDTPILLTGTKHNSPIKDILEYGGVEFIDCVLEDSKNREFMVALNGLPNSLGVANIKGNITVVSPFVARRDLDINPHDITLTTTSITTPVNVITTINASVANASEINQTAGVFTISRSTNQPTIPTAINYQLTGTATQMQDYSLSNGFVIIPPNQNSTTATYLPLQDKEVEPSETIIANLITNPRALTVPASYSLGSPASATIVIDAVVLPVPLALRASGITQSSVNLEWDASIDNISVTAYEVFKNGISIGISNTNSMIVGTLSCSSINTFTVKARDGLGNASAASVGLTLITAACGPCVTLLPLASPADDYSSGTVIKQANASTGKIIATNKITNTANVTYQAGKSIVLDPGFKVDAGTVFKVQLGGCN
ncbi:MAG: right-handed parallel beta-helix repeat-containing protein [Cytophagales bacterium]|nr:MAG: right-handed parallel beta-helix repeat-containing protein [Cytophagales bacterium]